MTTYTTYCNPGKNWAKCLAYRYDCPPEVINEVFKIDLRDWETMWTAVKEMKHRGYKSHRICESCKPKVVA